MENLRIGIIGLGYVGLPLAVEFGKKISTVGFDINEERVDELKSGFDRTKEVGKDDLVASKNIKYTTDSADLKDCNFFIVTVPTPVDKHHRPVLTPLIKASETVGKVLKKNDYVVYESTVYPGCTEDDCVPILEKESNLKFNEDFFVGYSPERINPGDKLHTVTKIKKVTSGSNLEAAKYIDDVYKIVIEAGTFSASSIKVAEAAKVIENSQRDINIAFVNELSKIFCKMGIDTTDVLEAAGTKWNFLPFRPGLVGGHCIGVDPYYLAQKAEEVGYHPEIILAGRRVNDSMGRYVSSEVIKLLISKGNPIKESRALVLGITFKENCPDVRNTKSIDVVNELKEYNLSVDVYDPWADPDEVNHEYGLDMIENPNGKYDAIILSVAHKEFLDFDFDDLKSEQGIIYDVKSFLPRDIIDYRL